MTNGLPVQSIARFLILTVSQLILATHSGASTQVSAARSGVTPTLLAASDVALLAIGPRPSGFATTPTDLNVLIYGLQRKYSRMQGIAADFTQTYQGPDGRFLKESGHLVLKRPRKARWDYSAPEKK